MTYETWLEFEAHVRRYMREQREASPTLSAESLVELALAFAVPDDMRGFKPTRVSVKNWAAEACK